jgi:Protein of unknown function (DUF2634).
MSNPFVSGSSADSAAVTEENSLSVFTEYAWDFANDRFLYEAGKHKIVTENEALKVWIYKALKTERWRYRVYDNDYGIELEQFIGRRTNNSSSAGEVEQFISEALLANPYIKSIEDMQYSINGDSLSYEITLTTIYGSMTATNQ